jgi:hypothetical protein
MWKASEARRGATKWIGRALAQYERVMMIDPRAAEARFGVAITFIHLAAIRSSRDL